MMKVYGSPKTFCIDLVILLVACCLIIRSSAAIFPGILFNFIIVIFYSWIIGQLDHLFSSLKKTYDANQEKFEATMGCCGFVICNRSRSITCFDYIQSTVNTYGSSFIAMLVSNIIFSIIILVGIECLFRYKTVREKLNYESKLWTVNLKTELLNAENGMWRQSCLFLKKSWSRNPTASKFGYLSASFIVVDFGSLLVLLLIRFNYNDLTSAGKLYAKTTDYFNEGYLQDGLLITMLCLFVWSLIAKLFYFVGVYLKRKNLFAAFFCSELLCLMIYFVVFGLKMKLFVNERTAYLAIFLSVSVVYIIFKIIYIFKADSVFRCTMYATNTSDDPLFLGRFGFVRYVNQQRKEHNLVASLIIVSVLLCIVDFIQIIGLPFVRYGYSSRHYVTQILNGIELGTLKMSENRDGVVITSLVSCIPSFLLQFAKWIFIGTKKNKNYPITWIEVPLLLLQVCSSSMVIILIKLLYCCNGNDGCSFNYDSNYWFCHGEVHKHLKTLSWFVLATGILIIFLQVLSVYFGFKYFKQSTDGYLGIFKGVSQLFNDIWKTLRKNRTTEFILRRLFYGFNILSLVFNGTFAIGIVLMIVAPGYLYGNGLLQKLSDQTLSLTSNTAESTIIGILWSLMPFIYFDISFKMLGIGGLISRKAAYFQTFIFTEVAFCVVDVIYLIFSSDVLHAAYCYCDYGSYCKHNFNSRKVERDENCSSSSIAPIGLLIAFVVLTLGLRIISLVFSNTLSKGLTLRIGTKDDQPKDKEEVCQQSTIQEARSITSLQSVDNVIENEGETLPIVQLSDSFASSPELERSESEGHSLDKRNIVHIETLQNNEDDDVAVDDDNDDFNNDVDLLKTVDEMRNLPKDELNKFIDGSRHQM